MTFRLVPFYIPYSDYLLEQGFLSAITQIYHSHFSLTAQSFFPNWEKIFS